MAETKEQAAVEEVALEAERSRFAIGDPFTRIRFPRESGVLVSVHTNFFYATDSTGSFLDPVASIAAQVGQKPVDGDTIIVHIGEMDVLYRSAAVTRTGHADSAAGIGAAVAALMRTFAKKHPGIVWKVAALREDPAFEPFYAREKEIYPDVPQSLVVSDANIRSKLRSIVNLIVSEELRDSPIHIHE
jgi:hypothetical protein